MFLVVVHTSVSSLQLKGKNNSICKKVSCFLFSVGFINQRGILRGASSLLLLSEKQGEKQGEKQQQMIEVSVRDDVDSG